MTNGKFGTCAARGIFPSATEPVLAKNWVEVASSRVF
jgi:hypothetical protein